MIRYGGLSKTPRQAAQELIAAAISDRRKLFWLLDDEGEGLTEKQREALNKALDIEVERMDLFFLGNGSGMSHYSKTKGKDRA